MPRQQFRKEISGTGDESRPGLADASGDTVSFIDPRKEHRRSRSKNKIPKSIRNDLENTLVSLCDLWFEEIKPHLVQNNVKLHVQGQAPAASASGDYERPPPLATPGCSHRDPGAAPDHLQRKCASCADCCLARLTALRAQCRRRRGCTHQLRLPPLPSLPTSPKDLQPHVSEEKPSGAPRGRPKKRKVRRQSQPVNRVPRLCQSYKNYLLTDKKTYDINSHLPGDMNFFQFIGPYRRTRVKTKKTRVISTQTACVDKIYPTPSKLVLESPQKKTATSQNRVYPKNPTILFQDDLIHIIGERNDKRQLMKGGIEGETANSIMKLYPHDQDLVSISKKIPPWK